MDYHRYGRERGPNVSSHKFQRSERFNRDFTDRYSDVSRRRMESFGRLDRNRSQDSDMYRRHVERFERLDRDSRDRLDRDSRDHNSGVSKRHLGVFDRLDTGSRDCNSDVSSRHLERYDRSEIDFRDRNSNMSGGHLKGIEQLDSGFREPVFGESSHHSHWDCHKLERGSSFRQFDHEYFHETSYQLSKRSRSRDFQEIGNSFRSYHRNNFDGHQDNDGPGQINDDRQDPVKELQNRFDRNSYFDRQSPDVEASDIPPAPAWPSDKLHSKAKSKDDVMPIQRKSKSIKSLRKKEERILEHLAYKARALQNQLKKTAKTAKVKYCRIYYIMDTNITSGKIPINHRDLLLGTWNKLINESKQDSDEIFIGSAQFVGGYLEIKLISADSLPILETIAAKLPVLYPNANLRLIPGEQRRATMYLRKGTISKSNAEILKIIAEQNAVCTDQWVIHYRTELEEKDFLIMKIDHKSALEFPTGGEKLAFEKSFVTIKLSPNHLVDATKPTKKEMKYLMQVSVPKTKNERKEILQSMNHQ